MNIHRYLLYAYQFLLRFYPPPFRKRFAPEMLELAEAAEPAEWPLIFGDTSVAILRCWLQGSPSTAVLAEPNAYLSLGESPVGGSALLHGFVLSIAIIAGLCYVNYRWTPCYAPEGHRLTHLVAPSHPQSYPQCKASSSQVVCR
jgi:hypothetical protein